MPQTIMCPYFSWENGKRFKCDAACIDFPDHAAKKEYQQKYCASHGWENCSIAKMMADTYERMKSYEKRVKQSKNNQAPRNGAKKAPSKG